MENYIEVIQQLLPLLDTMEEGVIDIQRQLRELRHEGAMNLLEDVLLGTTSIEDALEPMMVELPDNNIGLLGARFKEAIDELRNNYSKTDEMELGQQMEDEMRKSFLEWKDEIERVLKPFTLS